MKTLDFVLNISRTKTSEKLTMRHPLLLFSLWQLKLFNPHAFKYFLFEYVTAELLHDLHFLFFKEEETIYRSTVLGVYSVVGLVCLIWVLFREEKKKSVKED